MAGAAIFGFDALGRMRTRTVTTSTDTSTDTYSFIGDTETACRIVTVKGTSTTTVDSIVGSDLSRLATKASGATVAFGLLIPDLHGNVAAAVAGDFSATTDALRYDAWGNVAAQVTSALPTPWRYQGRLLIDPAGGADLYDVGARFYSPGLGTFTQFDSVAGSAQNPISMNRYLMPGFPKGRPPANAKALETWISQKAREDGVAVNRLRRGISFMVISAVLGRLVDDQGLPLFLLKGGVAMELRVGLQARASRAYDTAFRQAIDRVTHVLAEAESYACGDFRVTPGKAVPIGPTGAVRIPLRLEYGTHAWGSVDLEVAAAEGRSGSADTIEYVKGSPVLSVFGLPDVEPVALLPLSYQIAQKIHACTEVKVGKDNDRFRDPVDLILLGELVVDKDLPSVREACLEVFSIRGTHPWPPKVVI